MVSTIVETYPSNSSGSGSTGLAHAIGDVANNAELASFGETVQPHQGLPEGDGEARFGGR
jgi:hypothetical protein